MYVAGACLCSQKNESLMCVVACQVGYCDRKSCMLRMFSVQKKTGIANFGDVIVSNLCRFRFYCTKVGRNVVKVDKNSGDLHAANSTFIVTCFGQFGYG